MPDLSLADAYFEAMSGLTATGATVLSGLDDLPDSINLWRAQLHWIGGLGVIVLVAAVLPLLGVGGRQMFKAEMPTPMKDQKLTPRMAETAKGLWLVYVILTAALHPGVVGPGHVLLRCRGARLFHHGPGWVLLPRRQPGPLRFPAPGNRRRAPSPSSPASTSPPISPCCAAAA
jgi:hypothetical protein